jgi:hypothetical protein
MTSIKPWVTSIYVPRVNFVVNQPQRMRAGTFVVPLRFAIQYGSCAHLPAFCLVSKRRGWDKKWRSNITLQLLSVRELIIANATPYIPNLHVYLFPVCFYIYRISYSVLNGSFLEVLQSQIEDGMKDC